ncbi:MAG: hypothetical protein J6Q55_00705 [Clostridia bacterium]|nr:hypothetical protein [Clostridia bacterium]
MKKILVLMLAFVMVFAACALTACAKEVTYTGEYKYVNAYGDGSTFYGAAVTVTVKGDKITAVEVAADTATMFNLSANWTVDYTPTGTPTEGKQAWLDNGEAFAQSFVGMTVAEVNAIVATATANGQTVSTAGWAITGGTQSSARIIVAIQDALSKLGA